MPPPPQGNEIFVNGVVYVTAPFVQESRTRVAFPGSGFDHAEQTIMAAMIVEQYLQQLSCHAPAFFPVANRTSNNI